LIRSLVPFSLLVLAAAALGPCAACSKASDGGGASSTPGAPSAWSLSAEPAGAVSVVEAQKAAPKDDVVVVGRVRLLVSGLAAFTMVDKSVAYCGDPQASKDGKKQMEEVCEEPWDYCCNEKEAAEKQIAVVVPGADGHAAAGSIPELRNLDLVVVKGRLVKDKAGNVELAAVGWYRKERPVIPASVKFPQ
jgi:hypothetical protein